MTLADKNRLLKDMDIIVHGLASSLSDLRLEVQGAIILNRTSFWNAVAIAEKSIAALDGELRERVLNDTMTPTEWADFAQTTVNFINGTSAALSDGNPSGIPSPEWAADYVETRAKKATDAIGTSIWAGFVLFIVLLVLIIIAKR